MKLASFAAAIVLLVVLSITLAFTFGQGAPVAQAQANKSFEYAYIVKVNRLESYNIELERWAGAAKDKDYLGAHVFAYEQGETIHIERLNSLTLLNRLAGEGWELFDAQQGVLRRSK